MVSEGTTRGRQLHVVILRLSIGDIEILLRVAVRIITLSTDFLFISTLLCEESVAALGEGVHLFHFPCSLAS